jgi:hypothetical protein
VTWRRLANPVWNKFATSPLGLVMDEFPVASFIIWLVTELALVVGLIVLFAFGIWWWGIVVSVTAALNLAFQFLLWAFDGPDPRNF